MSMGRINNFGGISNNPLSGAEGASSIVLEVKKKQINIEKKDIKNVAHSLAEIAFSMGNTNEPEEFAEFVEEDIIEAFKKAKKKREKKGHQAQ